MARGTLSSRVRGLERATRRAPAPPALVWLALGTVYVIWGSTYFAIRKAILTLPPLLMASTRFLVAGSLLYAWAIRRGDRENDRPRWPQWRAAIIVGVLLLFVGNGGVVLAERTVPIGIAALTIATIPLWMSLIDRIFFGQRLAPLAIAGLALGFGGLGLLAGGIGGGRLDATGMVILLVAAIGWSTGSMYSRRAPLPSRPLVGTAMEMIAGGIALAVAGAVRGEFADIDPSRFSIESLLALGYLVGTAMEMLAGGAALAVAGAVRGEFAQIDPGRFSAESLLGLGYLVVFGSLVAFSAYIWLLRTVPISLVSTYAYVNPVVAVFLGWAFLGEQITPRTLAAGAVILVAVALIISARKLPPGNPADCAPEALWVDWPRRPSRRKSPAT